jgi:predicted ester cyclase
MVKDNEAVLMRAVEGWNAGNLTDYLELYDENVTLHAGSHELPDKNSVRGMYEGFFAAVSNPQLAIHEVLEDEDRLCCRYTVTTVHTGELMGIPATGKEIAISGITLMHFGDGRVVERWDVDDSFEVFTKLRELSSSN